MKVFFLLIATSPLLATACATEPQSDSEPTAIVLPTVGDAGNCETQAAVDLCTWGDAFDAVVIGTVSAIEADTSRLEVSINDGGFVRGDSCEGTIDPIFTLVVDVSSVLAGDAPSQVRVWVPATQAGSWSPTPVWTNSQWTWPGGDGSTGFGVGQEVGLGLFYKDDLNVWTTSGGPLLSVEQNVVELQQGDLSCVSRPQGLSGVTVDAARDAFTRCDGSAGDDIRQQLSGAWRRDPTLFPAGVCHVGDVALAGCGSSTDCPAGTACDAGVCRAQ